MNNKLYVGNLSYQLREDGLREIFEKIGSVTSAKVIMDRETDRSRGFGFVEMVTEDDATKAVSDVDGQEHGGRELKVSIAKERVDRRDQNSKFSNNW